MNQNTAPDTELIDEVCLENEKSSQRMRRKQKESTSMTRKWRLPCAAALIVAVLPGAGSAQWLDYPTAGVPRTADGKPNLSAPAPRTADGKLDLSGMWGWETRANCGAHCNDFQLSREFMNIAASLKEPLPYQPGVADLVKNERRRRIRIPMSTACRAARRESGPTTITSGSLSSLTG